MGAAPDGPTPRRDGAAPLVGREREQTRLRDALTTTLAGRGSLVLIGGEAGIGKTTLAEALLSEAAARGALVLIGRCYDLAETPPYGPWAVALDRAPDGDGLPALPAALLPPERADGAALPSQEAILRRVRDYLTALAARQPLVLLLEDLHWADPASLDLLRVAARTLADVPLLLLATYRAEEVARGQPLFARLPLLAREARAKRLDLRPLDAAAIDALVASRYALTDAARARLVAYLAARTEGNPLFLGELLRTLEAEGGLRQEARAAGAGARWCLGDLAAIPVPALLRQVIAGRLHRLAPETERLLAIAAIIGQEVPLALWAAVAETPEVTLLDRSEEATAARLLVETADGLEVRFAHALIREALYEGTAAPRRRAWHRRVAEALSAATSPDPDAVANQFQRAGDPRAEDWLARAGARAQRVYAWLTAAERYEAALALLEARGGDAAQRGWLFFRLALLRRHADMPRALAHAEAAICLAGEAGDPLLAAMATFVAGLLHHWESLAGSDRMKAGLTAVAALPASARVPPGAAEPMNPAPRWGTVAHALAVGGRYAEALALAERYLAEVTAPAVLDWLGGNPYADAQSGLGEVCLMLGQPERARAAFARARELHRAMGSHQPEWIAAEDELFVLLYYYADRPAEVQQLQAEATAAQARARGALVATMQQYAQAPWLLVLTGKWAEARRSAGVIRAAATWGTPPFLLASACLGTLARAQGDAAGAAAEVAASLPGGPETPAGARFHLPTLQIQRLAALQALDAGDLERARVWLAARDRWLAWSGSVLGRAEGALGWAAYHHAAGDPAAARAHAVRALAHATAPRQPLALLAARRALGELDTADGRHAEAQSHLDGALALAELRAAEGQTGDAAAPLAEARGILADLGAAPALARADVLAARLADPPPPAAAGEAHPFGLTAREDEVMRLVATGLTNAQVAARLFVTPRTVNAYLTAIYGKLGVENRAAAIRTALDHGLR